MRPLCFVLLPSGRKADSSGTPIDFDALYQQVIAPAISEAGLEPLRAQEAAAGAILNQPTLEQLLLCDYVVADLTAADATIFYQLGMRHAARPGSTALIYSSGAGQLAVDVATLQALPYHLGPDGKPSAVEADSKALAGKLRPTSAVEALHPDLALYQLLQDYPNLSHEKTDVFRDRVRYSPEMKRQLAAARQEGIEALCKIEAELADLREIESAVVVDLFLSYRAVKAWPEMIALVEKMSPPLAATVMVREQLALALNRTGKGTEAEQVLKELIERRGPSSETCAILGRVYKDQWEAAAKAGKNADDYLRKAVDAYLAGFESDWRDAFPGVNAVTLMELMEPPDPRREELVPVVAYAVKRKKAAGRPDYWDYATQLELAVLGKKEKEASEALGNALAAVREKWEPETTVRNLRLIREARERRAETVTWANEMEEELARAAR